VVLLVRLLLQAEGGSGPSSKAASSKLKEVVVLLVEGGSGPSTVASSS
jgi:hypothetical protein